MDAMERLLDEALADGACGFSTGLMYAPGSSAPREELERLCSVAARREKIYTTHMRDYSGALVAAVEEQIELSRRSGCRLQISHFQAVGQKHWAQQRPALERIEGARADVVDVAFDCYPYVAGSTVLTLFLPQAALDGGNEAMLRRISTEPARSRIAAECDAMLAQTWDDIFVSAAGTPAGAALVGRSVADIARERGTAPATTVLDLLIENDGQVNVLEFNQSEENLRETLTHPLSTVISDGFYVSGRPHPRLAGTFPALLGEMARRRGWLTLEEAVRKITSAPAERFGLTDRGRVAPGMRADLVVLDAERVGSPATYEQPELPPVGIELVVRGGRL
jgi:dihydroorotase/N-acyl-D-amino-acid deacylase